MTSAVMSLAFEIMPKMYWRSGWWGMTRLAEGDNNSHSLASAGISLINLAPIRPQYSPSEPLSDAGRGMGLPTVVFSVPVACIAVAAAATAGGSGCVMRLVACCPCMVGCQAGEWRRRASVADFCDGADTVETRDNATKLRLTLCCLVVMAPRRRLCRA